jgi:hypothetical protein
MKLERIDTDMNIIIEYSPLIFQMPMASLLDKKPKNDKKSSFALGA